jgi:hypothetical protein
LGTIIPFFFTVDFHRGALKKDQNGQEALRHGDLSYSDDRALNQYFSEFGNVTSSKS